MIGGFSGEDLKCLAHVTVRLQVSDCSQLSDYNFADKLEQNTAVCTPITFEEIVIVMIKYIIPLQVGFVKFHCPAMQKDVDEPTKLKFSLHL